MTNVPRICAPALLALSSTCLIVVGCGGSATHSQTRTATAATATPSRTSQTTPTGTLGGTLGVGPDALTSESSRLSVAHALVETGIGLAARDDCRAAIEQGFDPAIRIFESQRRNGVVYRAQRAARHEAMRREGQSTRRAADGAILIGADWPDAYFRKAYCQIELRDWAGAEASLGRALTLMPEDFVYLAELGFVYQQRRQWRESIQLFRRAQRSADRLYQQPAYGPTRANPYGAAIMGQPLLHWRTRARRGIGFSLIELGRLDQAEALFQEVLRLDPTDEDARRELAFIEQRRQPRGAPTFRPVPRPRTGTAGSI